MLRLRAAFRLSSSSRRLASLRALSTSSQPPSKKSSKEPSKPSETPQQAASSRETSPERQPQQEEPQIRDSAYVQATAERQRRQQAQLAQARWASSWMTPWERAQMDSPTRPLSVWERVYWRLFLALGSVGLIYETWVMGNRRLWLSDEPRVSASRQARREMYDDGALRSTRMLSDEEIAQTRP